MLGLGLVVPDLGPAPSAWNEEFSGSKPFYVGKRPSLPMGGGCLFWAGCGRLWISIWGSTGGIGLHSTYWSYGCCEIGLPVYVWGTFPYLSKSNASRIKVSVGEPADHYRGAHYCLCTGTPEKAKVLHVSSVSFVNSPREGFLRALLALQGGKD